MSSDLSVEARLSRAATILDAEVERHAAALDVVREPAYLEGDELAGRRRSSAWTSGGVRALAAVAAAVALVAGAALVATGRDASRDDAVTPPVASSTGARAGDGEGWSDVPAASMAPRFQHVAESTDRGVLVWGGYGGSDNLSDGAFFDPSSGSWRTLPDAPLAADRGDAVGVWTGSEVVLVNGIDGDVQAAAFDPSSFEWRALPDPPLSNAANMMTKAVVVDGAVVVVTVSEEGDGGARNEIAVYTPGDAEGRRSGSWSIGEPPPGSFGSSFDAVVVGGEVVVVAQRGAGGKTCGEAVVHAYTVASDRWRSLPVGPIGSVFGPAVVSTGSEVFVGGGVECGAAGRGPAAPAGRPEALLLDPATGAWRPTTPAPVPFRGDDRYAEVWSGRFAVGRATDGRPVLYDPSADRWHVAPATPLGAAYGEVPWVWHDGALILTSGGTSDGGGCCRPVSGGYAYSPPYDWRSP